MQVLRAAQFSVAVFPRKKISQNHNLKTVTELGLR